MDKKEAYDLTVQALLEESDSDDSDSHDLMPSAADAELEKFKQKAGLNKYAVTAPIMTANPADLRIDVPKTQSYTKQAMT